MRKKLMALLLAASMVVGMTACGSNGGSVSKNSAKDVSGNMMKQLLMESSIRKQRILQVIRLSLHIITLIRMKQLSILQSVS